MRFESVVRFTSRVRAAGPALCVALAALLMASACASGRAQQERPSGQSRDDGIEPYGKVVTSKAVTDTGLFLVHRIDETLLYEIPTGELDQPFLWVARIARAQTGTGYGGQKLDSRVVRWERVGDRVLLRNELYEIAADSTDPIYTAVENARLAPVLASFPVKAVGEGNAPVIEVTELFTTDVPEFSPRRRLGAKSLDEDRSIIESARSFPDNVEVQALLTFEADPDSVPGSGGGFFGSTLGTISALMNHSMVRLPADPMQPRLWDERVGFFSVEQVDYSSPEHRAEERRFITRWRLEKKDPSAELSEPVKPIVYWIDRATPKKWIPWLKKGVESWNEAFEQAGFRNAVVAREAPTVEEDPDWSPEDARHSVIRWLPSTVENASGPHVHDPRTGEILESDLQWYHNVQNLLKNWYFTQTAAVDPRNRSLPLPDSLMGRLIEYVAAHEVGHTLGYPHNMKASASYPVDSLRSPTFTEVYGTEASIMDYGRFNYVAQPEDGVTQLVPVIGPYDRFVTEWGYKPIPGGPDQEKAELDRMARRAEEDPMLRFGDRSTYDPTSQTESIGDDPVEATRLGVANLRRIVPMLIEAAREEGESYEELDELWGELVDQWEREMGHVVTVVGGIEETRRRYGTEGVVYHPVPRAEQERAMAFLAEHALEPPTFFVDEDVMRRIRPVGAADRLADAQRDILEGLLDDARMARLVEVEARARPDETPYPLEAMLADLRGGVWDELDDGRVAIGPYRRTLQRHYLDIVDGKLNRPVERTRDGGSPFSASTSVEWPALSDARPLLRGELEAVRADARRASARAANRVTRLHLADVVATIDRILDPRAEKP